MNHNGFAPVQLVKEQLALLPFVINNKLQAADIEEPEDDMVLKHVNAM